MLLLIKYTILLITAIFNFNITINAILFILLLRKRKKLTRDSSNLMYLLCFDKNLHKMLERKTERKREKKWQQIIYFYSRSLKDYMWMMACIVHFMVLRWFDVVIASFRSQHSALGALNKKILNYS